MGCGRGIDLRSWCDPIILLRFCLSPLHLFPPLCFMYFFLSLELSGCQSPVPQFCFFYTPPLLVIVFSQCHSVSPQSRYSQLTVLQPFCIWHQHIFLFSLNLLLGISLVVCAATATHMLQSHYEGCSLWYLHFQQEFSTRKVSNHYWCSPCSRNNNIARDKDSQEL